MLQQTRAEAVARARRWERWLEEFPNIAALAAAPEERVLRAWEGLGYQARALRLRQAAQILARDHGGDLPRSAAALRALPGVGPYTADALMCFAFGQRRMPLDVNVLRVLRRISGGAPKPLAAALMRRATSPRALAGALMELGQTLCGARAVNLSLIHI